MTQYVVLGLVIDFIDRVEFVCSLFMFIAAHNLARGFKARVREVKEVL